MLKSEYMALNIFIFVQVKDGRMQVYTLDLER